MIRKLFSQPIGATLAVLVLVLAGALVWALVPKADHQAEASFQWDEQATQELTAEFHRLHELANEGNMEAVKDLMIGDDALVTFDLINNSTPVTIRSKQALDEFLDALMVEATDQDGVYELEMPEMTCRATATFGVCTEECTVHLKKNDGEERIDKLFGTAVAVKHADGWRWVQYHQSVGGPSKTYKNGELVTISAASNESAELEAAVEVVEEWKTPGIEPELSGIYAHPTDDNLYYVLTNLKPPYGSNHQPMLPETQRGKLLTVDKRTGEVVNTIRLADDDFGGLTHAEGYFYASLTNAAEVLKLDPNTFEVLQRIQLSSSAGGLDYDAERGALIAQHYVGHPHLAVIDLDTGAVTETLWSDESAMGLAKVDGDWLCTWASGWDPGSFSELRVIDQQTGKVRSRMLVDGIHTAMAPTRSDDGAAFISLVTTNSATGQTVVRKYSYVGESKWGA